MRRGLAAALGALAVLVGPTAATAASPVGFDRQSLTIGGKRLFLNSGEVHPFRMPGGPPEWRRVLRRMKAGGLNAISIYVPWSLHEPAQGRFRFDGLYDLEGFLAIARDTGLYVVVRHGPYVQGEIDGGGFPGWVLGRPGRLRTTDPQYERLWRAWDAAVLPRVARWQVGGPQRGTVIAVQVENEHPGDGAGPEAYLQALADSARANGITVPLLHNNQQLLGSNPAPKRFAGQVDLPGYDAYPYGFTCCAPWTTKTFALLDDFETRYRGRGGATRSPLYLPEVQGGVFNYGAPDGKTLQEKHDHLRDYATVQLWTLVGQGVTMVNQYMWFGGTTWGYLPFPNTGSTYDYAAPLRESTGMQDRFFEQRRLGLQLAAAGASLADTGRVEDAVTATRGAGALYAVRRNPANGSLHVVLRNADPGDPVDVTLRVGDQTLPPVRVPGHGARYLPQRVTLSGWRIDWTTYEVALARPDLLVLFGDRGGAYAAQVDGRRIAAVPGRARLLRVGKGKRVLVLDRDAAGRLWTRGDAVLVGPDLVEGSKVVVQRTRDVVVVRRGRLTRRRVRGPRPVAAPRIGPWRYAVEAPERDPSFDDRDWLTPDRTTTTNQVQPLTSPILDLDTYGIPGSGFAWYRGRFDGRPSGVCLEGRHRFHVWLNGRSLGTQTAYGEIGPRIGPLDGGLGAYPATSQPKDIAFPPDALRDTGNVLSVLVESFGHNMDAVAFNQAKQPRGLISAALAPQPCGFTLGGETVAFGQDGGAVPPVPGAPGGISWKVRGGDPSDYPNASGLFGERAGWYATAFDDAGWTTDPPALADGDVGWQRAAFTLRPPAGHEALLALEVPKAAWPADVWLNGVHVARAGRGPETSFALPPGVLRRGRNVLAVARWAVDGTAWARPRLQVTAVERTSRFRVSPHARRRARP